MPNPLRSFMKDLLQSPVKNDEELVVPIVVDNAKARTHEILPSRKKMVLKKRWRPDIKGGFKDSLLKPVRSTGDLMIEFSHHEEVMRLSRWDSTTGSDELKLISPKRRLDYRTAAEAIDFDFPLVTPEFGKMSCSTSLELESGMRRILGDLEPQEDYPLPNLNEAIELVTSSTDSDRHLSPIYSLPQVTIGPSSRSS